MMNSAVRLYCGTVAMLALMAGCGGFGQVQQGQVVAYDRDQGLVTLIVDSNFRDPSRPRFDVLPAVTVRAPLDPREMGPHPEPGKLLDFDRVNQRAVIYDAARQTLRTVDCTPLSEESGVAPGDVRLRRKRLPVVDRTRKTVQTYLPRERTLVTFAVPDEYLALPDDTWRVGDEIRYYFKDPARAIRLMNVSKTEMNKAVK